MEGGREEGREQERKRGKGREGGSRRGEGERREGEGREGGSKRGEGYQKKSAPTNPKQAYLVSEDLNLAVGSVDWLCRVTIQTLIGINDHVERVALHSLLGRELSAQTVNPQHKLWGAVENITRTP